MKIVTKFPFTSMKTFGSRVDFEFWNRTSGREVRGGGVFFDVCEYILEILGLAFSVNFDCGMWEKVRRTTGGGVFEFRY